LGVWVEVGGVGESRGKRKKENKRGKEKGRRRLYEKEKLKVVEMIDKARRKMMRRVPKKFGDLPRYRLVW
jgi:hypothetical protein